MTKLNFVTMTHNVWGNHYQDERQDSLGRLYSVRPPDLLATQELREWSRDCIDQALDDHERVQDEFGGWLNQSNLWWRRSMFREIEHGASDVGILAEGARLFWVRLQSVQDPDQTLIFSTAHLTWPGHAEERETGRNLRVREAASVVEELGRLSDGGPCIFTVDINDIGLANWELGNAGFIDSFSLLERHSPPTHPVIPSRRDDGVGTSMSPLASPAKAIDWIFVRGGISSRTGEVVEFFHRGISPSDHAPVVATLSLPVSNDGRNAPSQMRS